MRGILALLVAAPAACIFVPPEHSKGPQTNAPPDTKCQLEDTTGTPRSQAAANSWYRTCLEKEAAERKKAAGAAEHKRREGNREAITRCWNSLIHIVRELPGKPPDSFEEQGNGGGIRLAGQPVECDYNILSAPEKANLLGKYVSIRQRVERERKEEEQAQAAKAAQAVRLAELDKMRAEQRQLAETIRKGDRPFDKIDSIELARLVFPETYNFLTLANVADLNETKGKYIYLDRASVTQAIGEGKALISTASKQEREIAIDALVQVTNPRLKNFAFNENRTYRIVGKSRGVTFYTTIAGARRQALMIEILFLDSPY